MSQGFDDSSKVDDRGGNRITLQREFVRQFFNSRADPSLLRAGKGPARNEDFFAAMGPSRGKEFPLPRPEHWPDIISWPPQSLRANWSEVARNIRIAEREGGLEDLDPTERRAEEDRRKRSREMLTDLIYAFAERARLMRAISEENERYIDDAPTRLETPWFQSARFDLGGAPINDGPVTSWAMLINIDRPLPQNEVSAWGRNVAKTMDGGVVLADKDKVRVHKFSNQAVTLLAQECAAREWPETHLRVPAKHVDAVKAAFAAAGVDAIIIPTHKILPFLPGMEAGKNRVVVRGRPPIQDFRDIARRMRGHREEPSSDSGGPGAGAASAPPGPGPKSPGPTGTDVSTSVRRPRPEMRDVTPDPSAGRSGESMTASIFAHERRLPPAPAPVLISPREDDPDPGDEGPSGP